MSGSLDRKAFVRLTESMPQSCIDKMRMDIVIKSEKRLRAIMDGGNCREGIPGYRGQHRISAYTDLSPWSALLYLSNPLIIASELFLT